MNIIYPDTNSCLSAHSRLSIILERVQMVNSSALIVGFVTMTFNIQDKKKIIITISHSLVFYPNNAFISDL